jgi:hypothetical protein
MARRALTYVADWAATEHPDGVPDNVFSQLVAAAASSYRCRRSWTDEKQPFASIQHREFKSGAPIGRCSQVVPIAVNA